MKLCVDCRLIGCGGIGTFLKGLLKVLSNDKRFTLFLLYHSKDASFLPLNSEKIAMKSPIYSMGEQWEWAAKIPKCDLFFSPHFNSPFLPIRAKKRVIVMHDVFHLAHFKDLTFLQKIYAQMMYNGAAFLADSLITVSQFSKSEIEKYLTVKPKKISIIHNGVDLFKPATTQEYIRSKFRLPSTFVLALSGKAHKNLSPLIRGYQGDIVIAGNGKWAKEKHVHLIGKITDEELQTLYQMAELFVFPSLYEGFGYPPLEAMNQGCPVVASHRGSILEICEDAVEYVDSTDPISIRKGILNVQNNHKRRQELIAKGHAQVKKYELHQQTQKLIEAIYESCGCA